MSRTSEIKLFKSTYKNWVSVARDYHSRRPKIESHFRSGMKEVLNPNEVFSNKQIYRNWERCKRRVEIS